MAELKRPETLTGAVISFTRAAILEARYAPGSPLPEMTLARELNTSRGTVREALRALEDQGLVQIYPHRGAFVSRLTTVRAREIIELRALLESYAIRAALMRGKPKPEAVDAARSALDALGQANDDGNPSEVIEADMALHHILCAVSENRTVLKHLDILQVQTRQLFVQGYVYQSWVEKNADQHNELVDRFCAGDADGAAAEAEQHIRASGDRLLARMAALQTDSEPIVRQSIDRT